MTNFISVFSSCARMFFVVTFFVGIAQALFVPSIAGAQTYSQYSPIYYQPYSYNAYSGVYQQQDRESLLPKCTLSANPVLIDTGNRTTLSWTTSNASTVYITDVGTVSSSGQYTVYNVNGGRTFTLTAENAYGPRTCNITVYPQGGGGLYSGPNVTTYATSQAVYQPHNLNSSYYGSGQYTAPSPVQYVGTNGSYYSTYNNTYPYNYYGQPTTGYYGQNTYNDIAYTYAAQNYEASPVSYGSRTVRLSRVPYTGPAEDMVTGLFSLATLVTSLYGMRRILA